MGSLNIAGLVLSWISVGLLFRHRTLYRLQLLGEAIAGRPKPGDGLELARHKRPAWTGLACITPGMALQGFATLSTMLLWP
jgi:hypothetical protein